MGRLDGRRALVIGAASGIGRGVATRFAAEGAHVIAADIDVDGGRAVATEISNAGGRATTERVDVTSAFSVGELVDRVLTAVGGVDVLVHAPGGGTPQAVADMTTDAWDDAVALNLRGVFLTTRAVLSPMIAAGSGRIVIVGSQLAFCGAAGLAHYCAAKAGVHAFVKAVAREVAPLGITVNAVAPGPTDTPLLRTLPDDVIGAIVADVPLGRLGRIDEIVPTALLLASDDGGFYTGAVLAPCGGHVMH